MQYVLNKIAEMPTYGISAFLLKKEKRIQNDEKHQRFDYHRE
jgi:hypothetical protein